MTGINPLITNTTMVKYFGGMSVVPEARDWLKSTSRLYFAPAASRNIYVADLDPISGKAINVRLFISELPQNPYAIYVNETNSTLWWTMNGQAKAEKIVNFTSPVNNLQTRNTFGATNSFGITFDFVRNIVLFQNGYSSSIIYYALNRLQTTQGLMEQKNTAIILNSTISDFSAMTYDPKRNKMFFLSRYFPYSLYSINIDSSKSDEFSFEKYSVIGNSTISIGDRLASAWLDLKTSTLFMWNDYSIYTAKVSLDNYSPFGNFTVILKSYTLYSDAGGGIQVAHDE